MNDINMECKQDESFETEIWMPIKDFPDYQVSNQGNVRSLSFGKEKILKQKLGTNGYLQVTLHKERVNRTIEVHRLVLEAFVPNHNRWHQCNHKNGIKTDNRLENLEWLTPRANIRHAIKMGLNPKKDKRKHYSKLSANDVLEIINDLNAGKHRQEIARKFNVKESTVSGIGYAKFCWI